MERRDVSRIDPEVVRAMQLAAAGDRDGAAAALAAIVKVQPGNAGAGVALGDLLAESRPAEALQHFDRVAVREPRFPGLNVRRAEMLLSLSRFAEAEVAAQAAVRAEPANFGAHALRVRVLHASGNIVDAAEYAIAALRLRPESSEMAILAGTDLTLSGSAPRAVEVLRGFLKGRPNDMAARDAMITALSYSAAATQAERIESARVLATAVASLVPAREAPAPAEPSPERPLRIAYLAQDLGGRSAISFFIEGAFEHHDRERYPVTCYLTQANMNAMSPRLLGHLQRWVDVGAMSDEDLAARIRADGIDILVDLAGTTPGHRLRAILLRPAPIVVNAIGCPLTTGLVCEDYRFVDAVTDPAGYEDHWTESLVRLPGCFLNFHPAPDAPPARPPRSEGPITFGSLNAVQKLGPDVVALWSRVLKAVPDSRLLLKAPGFAHPRTRTVFQKRFVQQGIGADRVEVLAAVEDYVEHLRLYHRVDISLDPFPYSGTTTLCESMWMGVPYITLLGQGHAGRVGASLLTAVGIPELIARDADGYIRLAVGLAADASRLAELHRSLRERMHGSILCDGRAHARSIESAFREMWRARCAAHGSA